MSRISDKIDNFLLNYSYLFWAPLFIGTQCRPISLAVGRINSVSFVNRWKRAVL